MLPTYIPQGWTEICLIAGFVVVILVLLLWKK